MSAVRLFFSHLSHIFFPLVYFCCISAKPPWPMLCTVKMQMSPHELVLVKDTCYRYMYFLMFRKYWKSRNVQRVVKRDVKFIEEMFTELRQDTLNIWHSIWLVHFFLNGHQLPFGWLPLHCLYHAIYIVDDVMRPEYGMLSTASSFFSTDPSASSSLCSSSFLCFSSSYAFQVLMLFKFLCFSSSYALQVLLCVRQRHQILTELDYSPEVDLPNPTV
jgi:hypothetical protein